MVDFSSLMDSVLSSLKESLTNPLDLFVLGVLAFVIWKYFFAKPKNSFPPPEPQLPPLKKRDFTVDELKKFDGSNEDGRLLVAVDGKVFDVTRAKRLYGKEGPYGCFAGRDASRGLGTFSTDSGALRDEYDELEDLDASELDQMKEWAQQFSEKYPVVGRLLRSGEPALKYESDLEDTEECSSATDAPKDKST